MSELLRKIPHRPPALLLDRVIELGLMTAVCGLVSSSELCDEADFLPSGWGVEAMAQAAAVWVTAQPSAHRGGMLVQVKQLVAHVRCLNPGAGLSVQVEYLPDSSREGFWTFSGSITAKSDSRLLMEAVISIVTEGVE